METHGCLDLRIEDYAIWHLLVSQI